MRTWPVTYADPHEFEAGFAALRAEFEIPVGFPPETIAAAATARPTRIERRDLRDVPFVAIDPPGARDLDQIYHATRQGEGYMVLYAIADVASFVRPEDPVDEEARRRGVTIYAPDRRSPLHPPVMSEGSASLLPGVERAAVVWRITLDGSGLVTGTDVTRATVRNRSALTYADVQRQVDAEDTEPALGLLREIGQLRQEAESARGGVSLNLPSQYVANRDGTYVIEYDVPLPVENWNAQISLLTGIAAAELMTQAGIGLLRTLPAPSVKTLETLRRKSRALDVPFPDDMSYAEWVRSLDTTSPACLALLNQATSGLRGAGYQAVDDDPPPHAAIAAPYTHVTAPLRRLVDRFTTEIALAICAGDEPAPWAVEAIEWLPSVMGRTVQKERRFGQAILDFTEALVMRHRVGETFSAVVVDVEPDRITLQLTEPAIVTESHRTDLHLGDEVTVRLVVCDTSSRTVRFEVI